MSSFVCVFLSSVLFSALAPAICMAGQKAMDSRLGARLRNVLLNLVNHRETNLVGTALLTFLALYVSGAALLDRSVLHPLTPAAVATGDQQQRFPVAQAELTVNESSTASTASTAPVPPPPPAAGGFEPFPLFLLWTLALAIGRLFHWLFLPSLLGPLLLGLCLANFAGFGSLLPPPGPPTAGLLFEFAFLLVLIRAALAIDSVALRRQLALCTGLAILSPLAECAAVLLLSHFYFQLPLGAALLFGFALAPSSPAVIVPAVLRLRAKEIGTASGMPTAVVASTSGDNILVLIGFAIAAEIVVTQSDQLPDELSYTLTRIPTELLVGAILGVLAGVLLRSFPRPDAHWAHFQRTLLLLSAGTAFHFGTRSIGCALAGPVAVLLMTGVASMHWQLDNHRRTRLEENGFRLLWELLASPLLFLLLGTLLDFGAQFAGALVGPSLAILAVGLATRLALSMACAFACFGPNPRERLFLALSMLPKATLQASFVPILDRMSRELLGGEGPSLPVQTCLLAILLCAPLGEMLIRLLGPVLVRPAILPSATTSSKLPPQFQQQQQGMSKGKVTHSDPKDNLLRLELGPTDPSDPPNAASSPTNKMVANNNSSQQPMRDFRHFREQQRENAKL